MDDKTMERAGEVIARDWMTYLGYTSEQITAAEAGPDHSACDWNGDQRQCVDEHGRSYHPEADELFGVAEMVMFVLEHPAAAGTDLGYAHAVERVRNAASVLITHTRKNIRGCHCGWAELGKSHAQHVVDALAEYLTGLTEGSTTDG